MRRPFGLRTAGRAPGSVFAESTLAEAAWDRRRRKVARWGWAGLLGGAAAGIAAFAPAGWLAGRVASATGQRVLLADARGTVWNGSAVPVLTAGPDSRSAAMLPGRLQWSLGWHGAGLELRLRQPCCIDGELALRLRPGLGGWSVDLPPRQGAIGDWPAAWLVGLGAPWNSLQLGGSLRLSSPGLSLRVAAGRWRLDGGATIEVTDLDSPLATLDRLGSYRLQVEGRNGQPATARLSTVDGALLLSGNGQWTGDQFRFRGEARAAPGFEGALDNLLNLLGRRHGALAMLSIG